MALEEIVERLDTNTTRRTVVKTGAKLAYAVPIVAASFKLSATSVGAQAVSGLDPRCDGARCGSFATCNEVDGCICFSTLDGTGYCGIPRSCSVVQACGPGTPCPAGQVCAVGTCCSGDKVDSCVIPCAPGAGAVALGDTQAG